MSHSARSDSPFFLNQCHSPFKNQHPFGYFPLTERSILFTNLDTCISTSCQLAAETADAVVYLSPFLPKNSWMCQLTRYLSESSLWDSHRTVQVWKASVPAGQWRHQHRRLLLNYHFTSNHFIYRVLRAHRGLGLIQRNQDCGADQWNVCVTFFEPIFFNSRELLQLAHTLLGQIDSYDYITHHHKILSCKHDTAFTLSIKELNVKP